MEVKFLPCTIPFKIKHPVHDIDKRTFVMDEFLTPKKLLKNVVAQTFTLFLAPFDKLFEAQ